MGIKIDGKKFAKGIEQRLINEINSGIALVGRPPGLAVIRVGDDPASEVYVRNKEKACLRVGVKSSVYHLEEKITFENLKQQIYLLNKSKDVDGILVQLPLPEGINQDSIIKTIQPDKDVDGLHPLNLGNLLKGSFGPRPCTPSGVMALLSGNHIPLEGLRSVVVGRSILVGQPMALMLQAANATVTIAHSKTKNLCDLTKKADLLVVAAGKPNLIDNKHIKDNSIVIDVGIHRIPLKDSFGKISSYKLCGDVNLEEVISKAGLITPVPGGVGPMTVAMLLVNTVSMWQQHCGLSFTLGDLLP